MKFFPYDPDFDPMQLSPFEALKSEIFSAGPTLNGKSIPPDIFTRRTPSDHLALINLSEEQSVQALTALKPSHLILSCRAIETLDFLKTTDRLKSLILLDMPKITGLNPLMGQKMLASLIVEDCSRCTNIDAIANLNNLSMLRLSGPAIGGGWKKIDLRPIARLAKLRHLSLAGLRTPDESLQCLDRLPKLECLEIDGVWPGRELARMAALQPQLTSKSTFLKPLVASAMRRSSEFHDVDPSAYPIDCIRYMVSGKRGAHDLRPGQDDQKIERAKARWSKWLAEFETLYREH